jgi:RNA polymerase sigma-70 factor (ECF subfamily)
MVRKRAYRVVRSDGSANAPTDPTEIKAVSVLETDPPPDDELFIRRTFASDPVRAVELLYRRYFQPLCSHAVKYLGSRAAAEDLVSEVFCQFYAEGSFETITSSYRFYLYRTVRNRAFNFLRRELRRTESLDGVLDFSLPVEQQPDTISQYEDLYQDVERAINALPVDRRRIFVLRRFEDKKYGEIAAELKLSVKTVEVQIYRANRQILALLKDKWLPVAVLLLPGLPL